MSEKQKKKPVSAEKLAANRANAQRSTGPRTQGGKERASQNSFTHGFFAKRLFPTEELVALDSDGYKRTYAGYYGHYSPVGFQENLLVEKIAVESLRIARLLGHEQKVLSCRTPFEYKSMTTIIRYETAVSRQLEKAIDNLERLQEKRKAESNQTESADLESDEDVETVDEWSEATESALEEPPKVRGSSNAPGVSLIVASHPVQAGTQQGSPPTNGEPAKSPAETAVDNPPPPEDCFTNARSQTLTKVIERAMDPAPGGEAKRSLGSEGNYETNPDPPRFIETEEDEKFIQYVIDGKDLESLEDPDAPWEI